MNSNQQAGAWISNKPLASLWAAATAVGVFVVTMGGIYIFAWTPLQRYYLPAYIGSAAASEVGLWNTRYTLVRAIGPRVNRLATHADVTEHLTVTPAASRRGIREIRDRVSPQPLDHGMTYRWLNAAIYHGRSPLQLVILPAYIAGAALILGLIVASPIDAKRARERRTGRRIRGTELVTVPEFNQRVCPSSLTARVTTGHWRPNVGLQIPQPNGLPSILLPTDYETEHASIVGKVGSGKSVIITHWLQQIEARMPAQPVVVLDMHGDYIKRFYRPERGDVIINATDPRMPYWAPGLELRAGMEEAEAKMLAEAMVPGTGHRYFTEGARKIVAGLLEQYPRSDVHELVRWLTEPKALDARIKQQLKAYTSQDAPEQRQGMISTLQGVADALTLLPTRRSAHGVTWTATEWMRNPEGWVFLSSELATRTAMEPIHNVIVTMLIVRAMDHARKREPIWFMLDEFPALKLPRFEELLTESRKFGARVVLGYQGFSQIVDRYGRETAHSMLGMPGTHIVLKTTDPESAEWGSSLIAKVETERISQSFRDGWGVSKDSTTSTLQAPHEQHVVMASEIMGLPPVTGYIKIGLTVTRFTVAYPDIQARPVVEPELRSESQPVAELQHLS